MGKTIISEDNRFEWDKDKNLANIEKHGIAFEEILEVFDDPAFLTLCLFGLKADIFMI